MKRIFTIAISFLFLSQFLQAQVIITSDSIFNTAEQMFLANELFESGEPFAEELGYDLDDLDPMVLNSPDSISYSTGVENYEYSRYLLNTLNGRSGLGLHMMWSPIITANAAMQDDSFDGMFTGGNPNGYKEDDMLQMMIGSFGMNSNQTPPANAFPQFADFIKGNTYLPQTVAADFQMDYATTRWDRSLMDKTLNLSAMGQSMLKQYFWAQDMLGSFHDGNDEGVEATGTNSPDSLNSPVFDPNNDIYYGGGNVDGFIGQVLTAVSINKTALLINMLAYDGTTLGAVDPATYSPANGIQYFPGKIAVTESEILAGLPPKASAFTVTDATSNIFDQLSFLSATVNYKNMMNPADSSDAAHLAYHEVFDGYPFPAAMSVSGMPGPFDLMTGASKVIFLNIMEMHYNSVEGTFVDESNLDGSGLPVMENSISAVNASYIIATLAKFSEEFAGTPLQTMADNALVAQANYIIANFKDDNGGYYNSYDIIGGASTSTKTLAANAAIIKGLYAAYKATDDATYLSEANTNYNYLINTFYSPAEMVFRTEQGNDLASYTTWNLALLSAALREASLVGDQSEAAAIYTRVFKSVYNYMILTEAEQTGETGDDSDGDGIPYISGGNLPFVFADKAEYSLITTGINSIESSVESIKIFPNPANEFVSIELDLKAAADVEVTIFDMSGRIVVGNQEFTLANGLQEIDIQLSGINTGNYFIRVSSNKEIISIEKIVVIK